MIHKTKMFNNIKYDLIDSEMSNPSCHNCSFNRKEKCELIGNDDNCFIHGTNAIWIISKSFVRKEKLKKINDKENV